LHGIILIYFSVEVKCNLRLRYKKAFLGRPKHNKTLFSFFPQTQTK